MPDKELAIGSAMYACHKCRLYDPITYSGPDVAVWTFRTGNTLNIGGMTLPLSSDFIPCETHTAMIAEAFPE